MSGIADQKTIMNVLTGWITIEVLTPQDFPDPRDYITGKEAPNKQRYIELDIGDVPPWLDPSYSYPEQDATVFWIVYLGAILQKESYLKILETFEDAFAEEKLRKTGMAGLLSFTVDQYGAYVGGGCVSSFAWGLGQICDGTPQNLSHFPEIESNLLMQLDQSLMHLDEDNIPLPLGPNELERCYTEMTGHLKLPQALLSQRMAAIRVVYKRKDVDPPQSELLNSFFLSDLIKIRKEFAAGAVGVGLDKYLRGTDTGDRRDVLADENVLRDILRPEYIPEVRWTPKARYNLFLMQQAAVNHVFREMRKEDIVGINGPPGTGKTTLLRDIIAKVVFDRACAMVAFKNPSAAFQKGLDRENNGYRQALYEVHPSLLGHEIVIASSNNKAVENISRELPGVDMVDDMFDPPLRYFNHVADHVADGKETWGMAAAVLGNQRNRGNFTKAFWWDDEYGLSSYFKYLAHPPEEGEKVSRIIALEKPPQNALEAKERWRAAQKDFIEKREKEASLREAAIGCAAAMESISRLRDALAEVEKETEALRREEDALRSEMESARLSLSECEREYERTKEDLEIVSNARPGFFARIFQKQKYRAWLSSRQECLDEFTEAKKVRRKCASSEKKLAEIYTSLEKKRALKEEQQEKQKADYQKQAALVGQAAEYYGEHLPTKAFWENKERQKLLPWLNDAWQNARDELFAACFRVHRAFIDASADKLKNNLNCAMYLIQNGLILEDDELSIVPSLWASFFMVVPVISSTLASIARLFSKTGKEQLGWLLLDEAGQATPQSAVGAVYRARHSVVVGDPLQIPPVVTMPEKLYGSVFQSFGTPHKRWTAPDVSAQALADRASWFGTAYQHENGEMDIGAPLLVHRRCEEPMFSIANHIAYDGNMISDTKKGESLIGAVLGDSHWIDVPSDSPTKWSEPEGLEVIKLMQKLVFSQVKEPDLYIISPFRMVAQQLRNAVSSSGMLNMLTKESPDRWVNAHIGTIHTFQGKEADTVILVLGASGNQNAGARNWAGELPNILNVAVTRAKRRLYVVGNRTEWKQIRFFDVLHSYMGKQ